MLDRNASIKEAVQANIDGLTLFQNALTDGALTDELNKALDLIVAMSGRLIIAGMGKSGLIARKLVATFSSTGTPAHFVHPAEASHGDLGMIQKGDVLLLLSWSGETKELSDIMTYAARFAVPMIALTGSPTGTLAKRADVAIVSPKVVEACPHNLAPTTSTLVQLAVGDALAITLLKMKGFSEASFRDYHPGGKLGAILTPVSDVMHTGDAVPLLPQTASIIEVIGELSQKSLGVVGLTDADGQLRGVMTDGDIRRYLEANSQGSMKSAMWETSAETVMTREFISIEPQRLSARAMSMLESNRISAVFVVEDGAPLGVVTMLQLLQAGVA